LAEHLGRFASYWARTFQLLQQSTTDMVRVSGRCPMRTLQRNTRMNTGTVKWFNNQKGFGFIQGQDGKDVFVHISAVERAGMSTLNEGQKITFDIVANRKTGKSAAENLQAA
jgi:CspA family cold shock protein